VVVIEININTTSILYLIVLCEIIPKLLNITIKLNSLNIFDDYDGKVAQWQQMLNKLNEELQQVKQQNQSLLKELEKTKIQLNSIQEAEKKNV